MKALWQGNLAQAWQAFDSFAGDSVDVSSMREVFLYQLMGEMQMASGNDDEAEASFQKYRDRLPRIAGENEAVFFHLGNICAHKGDLLQALAYYQEALRVRKYYPEVFINIALLAEQLGDFDMRLRLPLDEESRMLLERRELQEQRWRDIPETDPWQIPIFINARDRLGCLRQLVDWLQQAGYEKIYILDNASTYQPLLDYYSVLEEQGIWVLKLRQNLGHTALWQSGILEKLDIRTPYVYTDPDVLPLEECPRDFVADLLGLLRKYPWLEKAGLGLYYEDITYFDAAAKRAWEKQFYQVQIEKEVYFAPVDTTLALYRDARHYCIEEAVRTGGCLMCRHLPWYYDYERLPEDERYYLEHANESSTLRRDWDK
jgi:tetratricopeptide (TPR) repeat protein